MLTGTAPAICVTSSTTRAPTLRAAFTRAGTSTRLPVANWTALTHTTVVRSVMRPPATASGPSRRHREPSARSCRVVRGRPTTGRSRSGSHSARARPHRQRRRARRRSDQAPHWLRPPPLRLSRARRAGPLPTCEASRGSRLRPHRTDAVPVLRNVGQETEARLERNAGDQPERGLVEVRTVTKTRVLLAIDQRIHRHPFRRRGQRSRAHRGRAGPVTSVHASTSAGRMPPLLLRRHSHLSRREGGWRGRRSGSS